MEKAHNKINLNYVKVLILYSADVYNKTHAERYFDTHSNEIEYKMCSETRMFLFRDESGYKIYYKENPLDIKEYDAVFSMCIAKNDIHGSLLKYLEEQGLYVMQTQRGTINSTNKAYAYKLFDKEGIPYPKSVILPSSYLYSNRGDFEGFLKKTLGDFPLLIKPSAGSLGIGVKLCSNIDDIYNTFKEYQASRKGTAILQEYISPDIRQDERHIVIGDKVVNSMYRIGKPGMVTTNLYSGAKGVKMICDAETEQLCVKAAKCVGLDYCGVDVIRGEEGKPYVLEVNSNPTTKIIDVTGYNHFEDVIEYIKEKVKK